MLKPGGTLRLLLCEGEHKRTDWFVRHIYEKTGFFTPPYDAYDESVDTEENAKSGFRKGVGR
ncbi:MAG: hypothetical protein ACLR6I_12100 [Waltera sp.]